MADRVGQQAGNYRLTKLLGSGGFADVYLAEHIHLGTLAAIKILQARVSTAEWEQFRGEARRLAQLQHPNIVGILDFGLEQGIPFLVMPYAPNGTLREHYPRNQQIPLARFLPHLKQVASALHYAHEQRFVHRDIKPENLLLSAKNEVLVSDFGIATIAESTNSLSTKDPAGTFPYMAPEQIQGKPRPASDQYALAIVTYEWLAGERPFRGSITELIGQHISASPPSLRAKVPALPVAVEQVVFKALAKEPKDRYASVTEFAEALERAQQARPAPVAAPVIQPQQPPLPPLPKEPARPVVVNPAAAPARPAAFPSPPAPEKKPEAPVRLPPYVAPPQPGLAPAKAPEPAQRPVSAPKVALSARKKRAAFRRDQLRAAAFSVGSCFFCLMAGLGAIVGTNTQSWRLAVGTVVCTFVLAYVLGYRKALPLLASLGIALVSAALVYALTVFLSGYDYGQAQTSHLWFDATRHLTLRSQIIAGACVGGLCSLWGFIVYDDEKDGFDLNFWLGLFIAAFGFGAILWLIVTAVSSFFDGGFGFGYGWSFNLLYGWCVTIIGGFGLFASTYIWRQVRRS